MYLESQYSREKTLPIRLKLKWVILSNYPLLINYINSLNTNTDNSLTRFNISYFYLVKMT